jgi:hypothetical protein
MKKRLSYKSLTNTILKDKIEKKLILKKDLKKLNATWSNLLNM